ncbi:branched-chain amino acid ABC transporter permease [Cupriavidus sp. USMAA2-4]|uniref:branched-chain amino acid ABC transporter permease n=1 Tax=unclassified Cupriavidus TaxID=2640874 RepID=UPI0008A6A552|nr:MULTISPECIES: branched-chain amino acid ABC transporter permease [unclassified Cupriavidus]AOY90732.1 branched-chain amino acid ABC transporter permease [Cupriavidus sp. USMAA2-4]AOY99641.1 branched-chain amino acid ABC transporter permease [Cupriavidus sp. USMAHM13]
MTDTTPSIHPAYGAPLRLKGRAPARLPQVALLVLAFGIVPWLGSEYWLNAIVVPFLVLSLAGLGLNLLTGYAGQTSLGSGGFMAVGAFAAYAFLLRADLSFPVALLLGGLAAALAGLLFGLPSAKIKGFYLMVTSLAAQFFLEWLFLKFPWFYNHSSSATISAPRLDVFGLDFDHPLGKYYVVLATVSLLTWAAVHLVRSQTGRDWMAIRDMDTAAAVAGIRVNRSKVLAFAVSAFYLGVAGALWAFAYLGSAGAQSFGLARSFQVLFIIIIGGLGSIGGSFIGAAFISLLPLGLDFVSQSLFAGRLDAGLLQNIQKVIFGVLIIGFLIKEPEGIARLLHNWRARLSVWPLRF